MNYYEEAITPNPIYQEKGKKYIRIASEGCQSCSGCVFDEPDEPDEPDLCDIQCEGYDYIFTVAPEEFEKTPEIYEATHPHHAVWREYTESLLVGKPKQVEYQTTPDDFWMNANCVSWNVNCSYRIKPEPKLFWYMNGEKVVEYVERVSIQERSQLEIQIDGVKISGMAFTTYFESTAVAQKLGEILKTLEVK